MVGRCFLKICVAVAAILVAGACSQSPISLMPEALMVRVKGPSLSFAWDAPAVVDDSLPSRIVAYAVYYRELSSSDWVYLGEIPAARGLQYTVTHERLGDGLFVFAVRSIAANGNYSAIHSSLDWNADPVAGWYVWWMRNE
jgi:hypothetical protein